VPKCTKKCRCCPASRKKRGKEREKSAQTFQKNNPTFWIEQWLLMRLGSSSMTQKQTANISNGKVQYSKTEKNVSLKFMLFPFSQRNYPLYTFLQNKVNKAFYNFWKVYGNTFIKSNNTFGIFPHSTSSKVLCVGTTTIFVLFE